MNRRQFLQRLALIAAGIVLVPECRFWPGFGPGRWAGKGGNLLHTDNFGGGAVYRWDDDTYIASEVWVVSPNEKCPACDHLKFEHLPHLLNAGIGSTGAKITPDGKYLYTYTLPSGPVDWNQE